MSDNYKKQIDRLIKIAGVKAVNRISDPIRVEDAYQPKKRKTLKEMIRVTADTPEEAQAFMALLKNAGIEQSDDMPHGDEIPHDEPHGDETPCGHEPIVADDEIKQGADYENSPDEEYEDDPQNTYSTKPTRRKDIRVNSMSLADSLMREWTDVRDTEETEEVIDPRIKERQVGEEEGRSAMDHIISHVNHARGILNHGHFSDDDEMEFQDHYKQIDDLINTKAPNSDILAKMRQLVPGVDDSEDEIRANLIKMIEIGKTAESVSKVGEEEAIDPVWGDWGYTPESWSDAKVEDNADYIIAMSKGQAPDIGSWDSTFDSLQDGLPDMDIEGSKYDPNDIIEMLDDTIGGKVTYVVGQYLQEKEDTGELGPPSPEVQKAALEVVNNPEFKKAVSRIGSGQQEQAGDEGLNRIKELSGVSTDIR